MPKVFTNIFTSIDGVVDADSDWQFPFFDDELFEWVSGAWDRATAVLLGRPSFEGYERLRIEHPESPVIAFLNRTPTFVVSDKVTETQRSGVEIIRRADVVTRVAALRQESDGDILLLGSPGLLRRLVERDVVDELNILVLPAIVGTGTRLFSGDSEMRAGLTLESSRALSSGAVQLVYATERAHETT